MIVLLEQSIFFKVQTSIITISRLLLTCLIRVGKAHPRILIDSLLLPMMVPHGSAASAAPLNQIERYRAKEKQKNDDDDDTLAAPQCEAITRIVRECLDRSYVNLLVEKLFSTTYCHRNVHGGGHGQPTHHHQQQQHPPYNPCLASDRMLVVVQSILNLRANLTQVSYI